MKIFGLLLAALVAGSAGCTKTDSFNCLASSECMVSGVAGVCELGVGEPGGVCSFPNLDCPSGKAFGEFAGEQAGLCVGENPGSTTTPTSSVSNTGTGPATSSETSVDPSNGTTVDITTMTTDTTMTSEVTVTTTTETTLTTDPSTTTAGPACAPLGDACTADTPCCGDVCTGCQDGFCVALDQPQDPGCGTGCLGCNNGSCKPVAAGLECTANCSDFVLQQTVAGQQTICNGYGPGQLMGSCDDGGLCSVPDPVAAGCVADMPTQLAVCDTTCVQNSLACTPNVTGFDKADFCALNGPGPGCKTSCLEDNSSNMASCDMNGICQQDPVPCGNYKCDPAIGMCPTKCADTSDCVVGMCKGKQCM
ncbi:MAG: hypothetical protein H0T76_26655 [Nannocystis sp.]|nr:hypothetical protein [Nannocystis sp.]MBA3550076.1 hypothetical protein [Nannocystis sp.]